MKKQGGSCTTGSRIARRTVLGAALLVAGLFAAAAQAAPAKLIPLDDIVRGSDVYNPVMSPDGQHLVVTKRIQVDGRDIKVIVVHDLADMKIISTVRLPLFEVPLGYRWITNKRLAVTTGVEDGSLEAPKYTGEVIGMDIDGRNQDYLYGYHMYTRAKRGATMADDYGTGTIVQVPESLDGHFLLNENLWARTNESSRLFDIDASNAVRRIVAEIPHKDFEFLVQPDGKPRFARGTDESAGRLVYRLNDATGQWQEMPARDRGNLYPISIAHDNSYFLALLTSNGGPRALVRQSMAGDERTVLASDPIGNIDVLERGPRPYKLFAVATSVGVPKPRYVDETSPEAQLHKDLTAQFAGSFVDFISFADDGNKLLFRVSGDTDPGTYYLLDRKAKKASVLFAAEPWIDPARMAEQRPIKFKSRDGVEIYGYLTLPPTRGDDKLPMVLLPHGGPYGVKDTWFYDTDAQFLASRGYAVLQINYRGSSGRGDAFERAGYKQWGGKIQQDLIDGVKWAIAGGAIDADRICAYGGSFGAYSAMMSAILEPGLFKCAVGYAGVYDLPQLYDEDSTKRSPKAFNYLVNKAVGQDQAQLIAFSPSRQAAKLKIPVLLVHGSEDKTAPPLQAETMRDALIRAGNPPEWMYVSDEGHGFYAEKNRRAFYEKLEAFLNKHIGPK